MHRREFIRTGGLAATALAARPLFAEPAAAPIRVAQIGTAHAHAAEKWATLQRLAGAFAPAGIWEPDAAQRARAAAEPEYRGARWLSEAGLFGDAGITGVLVETELPDLLAQGRRVLESGRHLHLDKPPGADLAAFAALQALAAQKGRVLQTGYMYRYHPAFQFCLRAVREGWLGPVFAVHGDIGKVIGAGRRPWLAAHYGGSMMLLGCHLLDLAVAVLGPPERITTQRRNTFPERDGFFDHEIATLEYPRALATVRSLLAEVGGEARRQFAVFGEKGTVEIRPLEPARVRLALARPAGGHPAGYHEVALPAVTGRYDEQLLDFARMVRGEPSCAPQFPPAHELMAHRVLLESAGRIQRP